MWTSYAQAHNPEHQACVTGSAFAMVTALNNLPNHDTAPLIHSQGLLPSLLSLIALEANIGSKEQVLLADTMGDIGEELEK